MHLGPDELLVAAKVGVKPSEVAQHLSEAINSAEARIRTALPIATLIFIEPDIYQPEQAAESGTDTDRATV